MPEDTTLRAVAAVPLREDLCALIETLEPRVQMIRDHRLTAPMRGPADWSGDPDFTRTPEQQRAFDEMVDSADALFGIPDVDPAALARTVRDNPKLRWVMTTAAGGERRYVPHSSTGRPSTASPSRRAPACTAARSPSSLCSACSPERRTCPASSRTSRVVYGRTAGRCASSMR